MVQFIVMAILQTASNLPISAPKLYQQSSGVGEAI